MSVELEEIGARVPDLPELPSGLAEAPGGHGRLPALARWWRTVSPDVGAAPSSVRHLWGDGGPTASSVLTATLTSEPFTVPGTVEEALEWGVRAADHAADDGVSLLIVSVPSGPVLTLAGHLLGLTPVAALGWPKDLGLTDAEWIARVAEARDGLKRIRELAWPTSRQLLDAVGSPELAAGVAVLLQATARTTPVLLDGPGATVCALMARHVARRSIGWMQAATDSGGRVQRDALDALRLDPLTVLDIGSEDGTAGILALSLIDAAVLLPAPAPVAPLPETDPVIDVRGPFPGDVPDISVLHDDASDDAPDDVPDDVSSGDDGTAGGGDGTGDGAGDAEAGVGRAGAAGDDASPGTTSTDASADSVGTDASAGAEGHGAGTAAGAERDAPDSPDSPRAEGS